MARSIKVYNAEKKYVNIAKDRRLLYNNTSDLVIGLTFQVY